MAVLGRDVLESLAARSVKGLIDLVNELHGQGVHFRSLTDGIDTKTPADSFFTSWRAWPGWSAS